VTADGRGFDCSLRSLMGGADLLGVFFELSTVRAPKSSEE